ncbi:MAG: hypothetical protein IPQ13_12230 [Holophagaceae bacterium]|nr:hypothetical protein [Holophagaceae bacterium]
MLALHLVLLGAALWLASGLAVLGRPSERASLPLSLLGSALGLVGAVSCLIQGGGTLAFSFAGFPAHVAMDALSAAFLLPLHLVAGLGALYGSSYWPLDAPKGAGRSLRFFFSLLAAAMSLVFLARQGIFFLLAWEIMAVAAFFLVGTDHEDAKVRRGAWVYLVATHLGTMILIAMVILLARRSGGWHWDLVPGGVASPALDTGILVLAVLGFGFKAGWIPFHFWLPAAHAGAPSHVSAILSAVMLKTGIYGVLRISGLLPWIPAGVGGVLLLLGAATALYGVFYALAERDFKRLLAYSSIENIGVIGMGIGLGLTGRATHDSWLTALGFGSALLHVWNHAAFKSLLFFSAGCVLHATGTRDMERLGGLAARMPDTARWSFAGALAVAALPPFGAFVSEWVLYRGFFAALLRGYPWSAGLALPALALAGGLAAVAFAKFFGFVFLGSPRSALGEHAHDPRPSMLVPMGVLASLCLALGLGSAWLLPALDRMVAVLAPGTPGLLTSSLGLELRMIGGFGAALLVLGGLAWAWARRPAIVPGPGPALDLPTWGCGYAAPSARMQYSADSFSDGWAKLLPGRRIRMRRLKAVFPTPSRLHLELTDSAGLGFLESRVERLAARALWFRRLQPGFLTIYLLYVLLALLGVFLWMLARPWLQALSGWSA